VSEVVESMQVVDNVFVKLHQFLRAGDTHQGHAHAFDHVTLLASGSVLMKHDNGEQEYKAPTLIVTPKGISHQFTAKEPNTVFCCIHAIRDGDDLDDVVSPEVSPEKAW
jgi:quercetin dioxygenase-like cupin family protein